MEQNRGNKLVKAQRINLFPQRTDIKRTNPQQSATSRLLEISDEELNPDIFDIEKYQQPKFEKQSNSYSEKNSKSMALNRMNEIKPSIAEGCSKTSKFWRKSSMNFLSGQEVCVMKKERVINISNFLIFQSDNNNKIDSPRAEGENDNNKSGFKMKPPKSVITYIRKRNISFLKDQVGQSDEDRKTAGCTKVSPKRNANPGVRLNVSCELRRSEAEPPSPIFKVMAPDRIVVDKMENLSPEMRSTSPNFRHKRISNYIKYRINGK